MEKKLHITFDEAIAFLDKKWEMFPDTLKHVEKCSECSDVINKYSEIRSLLISNRHVKSFHNIEKINKISEKSFQLIHINEETPVEKESFFTRLEKIFSPFFKPVIISSVVIAAVFAIFTTISVSTKKSEDMVVKNEEPDYVKENGQDISPGLKLSGEKISLNIASIEILKDTKLVSISQEEITINKGKAKFDIVSGNDFRINVNNKYLVRVLGTSFVLEYNNNHFSINVLEGLVEVVDKSDDNIYVMSANMEKVFNSDNVVVKKDVRQTVKNKVIHNLINNDRKLNITPDASFLFQGREAAKEGNNGIALQLFIMEIEKGSQKDKALFEAVKLHENNRQFADAVNLILDNFKIVNSSRIYKEEIMIKGCMMQNTLEESDLFLCRKYLEMFPDGYRKNEIREFIK